MPRKDRLSEAYERALRLEKAGERSAAAEAWTEVLALDPADHGGAAIRLAALDAAETPQDGMPEAYVRTLFDQHAEAFDEVLVGRLGYGVPDLMRERLMRTEPGHWRRLLDLGCGTGLVGAALGDLVDHASGVDLSEEMLALADARGAYDELYVGDAVGFLVAEADDAEENAGPWDVIAAADMVPYLGRLEPLFAAVAGQLDRNGLWLFSTETLPKDDMRGEPYRVGPKHRFAHAPDYIEAALAGAGLAPASIDPIVVRFEEGEPVPGHLVTARRMAR